MTGARTAAGTGGWERAWAVPPAVVRAGGAVAIAIFLGGAGLSAFAAYWQDRHNIALVDERLAGTAAAALTDVAQRMATYQYGLRGMRGIVLAVGPETLRREHIEKYGRTRDIAEEFPGARGFGFIRRVAGGPAGREAFERRLRNDGVPGARIVEFGRNDAERFVIEYVVPQEPNRAAIGLDIASEPRRRAAAVAAMDSGAPRLTAPLTLVQASGKPMQSFLLLLPIYDVPDTPATPAQRRRQLIGWSYAPLVTDELMRSIGIATPGLDFGLSDVTVPDAPQVIVPLPAPLGERDHRQALDLTVFGRRWRMSFRAQPAFVAQQRAPDPGWILFGGMGISCLAAALAGTLAGNRVRRRQNAAAHARLAAIVESSSDAIIGNTLAGVVTSWNRGAEGLFGYTAAEAVGRTVADLIVPPARFLEESGILARLATGEPVPHFETERLRKDGTAVAVSVTASPIRDDEGRVVGASKTVRDIAERKAMEALADRAYHELADAVSDRTARLRELNVLLTSILGSPDLAIIATDGNGIMTVFNRGAERMLGYHADELVGRSTPAMLFDMPAGSDDAAGALQALLHGAAEHGHQTLDGIFLRKDGSRIPVSVAINPLRDDSHRLTGYLGIAMDASPLRQAQAMLQAQHRELLAVRDHLLLAADVARLGVWSWVLDGSNPVWNGHMRDIYGVAGGSAEPGPSIEAWFAMIHPEDVAAARASLDAAIAGEREQELTFRIVRPDGQVRYLQTAARAEYDADGRMCRITGINLDVSERMSLVHTLQLAKSAADAASEAKSRFLANMSHEIRTPLNAVLGMLQILKHSGLSREQDTCVANASSAAGSLLLLLNDILDYSKIEAGKLVLDCHPFDVETLLRDLAVVLAGTQGQKDLEVIFDVDLQLPATLVGDRMRLQQVLINLAGNAMKFTERGEVVLSVEQLGRTAACATLRFAVADTGIGIAAEQQARIFDGFTQAEASISRRFGGTGLGLVICRRLVEAMGAELCMRSEPGAGSRFWFDVELAIEAPLPPSLLGRIGRCGLHALIVDDNPHALELLRRTVTSLGWRCSAVDRGGAAVAAAREAAEAGDPFQVVLMDWRMPDMDGVAAAAAIARLPAAGRPPVVIMVTAYGREALADLREGNGSGVVADLLTKPVTPAQLAEAAARALAGQPPPDPVAPARPRRLAGLRILVVEDNRLNRQVARGLLVQEGAAVTLAEDGMKGVAAVTAGDSAFDAVLMDIQMPEIDGLEATRRIRADARFAGLPVIAMTANASRSDEASCLAAGMDAYLAKPIDIGVLVATVLAHVTQPRAAVEPLSGIVRRFGGARDIYARMLGGLPMLGSQLIDTAAGQLARDERSAAAATLHTLKGTAATVGAAFLARRAGDLEAQIRAGRELPSPGEVAMLHHDLSAALAALAAYEDAAWDDGGPP